MNNKFSENLKKLRRDYHLSQEQLADELGVSRQAISKWESSSAYPEMDKIIALCDKFNINIDDLLHQDIREMKEEDERKKNLNQSLHDFLKYITDTVNLFSQMNVKSRVKCILEQVIIIIVLFIISSIIISFTSSFVSPLLRGLPTKGYHFLDNLFQLIIASFCAISSVIIWVHLFKTRYLDYYHKIKKQVSEEEVKQENLCKEVASSIELKQNKKVTSKDENKILLQKSENRIIIRDPNHSEYRFIDGLFKVVIGIIKFFCLCFSFFFSFTLVFLFAMLVLSFFTAKTGLVFWGTLLLIASSIVIDVILLLGIFNFVFNRKSDKKKMIWGFLLSLVAFGLGCGTIFVGILDFEILEENAGMLKTEAVEYEMRENLFFHSYYGMKITYVEMPIEKVKVEYTMNQFCNLEEYSMKKGGIYLWTSCDDFMNLAKTWLNQFNQKKIVPIHDGIHQVTVYASKENIEKLKSNVREYDYR